MFAHMLVLVLALMAAGRRRRSPAPSVPASAAKPIKMVVLGDSLSAGFGLPASAAFPARLQKALEPRG